MVYICSPLRANETYTLEQNVEQAKRICRACAMHGILGMAVHLYFPQFLDDTVENERECGLRYGLNLLGMCDEVWVFGTIISSGMQKEIKYAKAKNIPIKYYRDVDAFIRELEVD